MPHSKTKNAKVIRVIVKPPTTDPPTDGTDPPTTDHRPDK